MLSVYVYIIDSCSSTFLVIYVSSLYYHFFYFMSELILSLILRFNFFFFFRLFSSKINLLFSCLDYLLFVFEASIFIIFGCAFESGSFNASINICPLFRSSASGSFCSGVSKCMGSWFSCALRCSRSRIVSSYY